MNKCKLCKNKIADKKGSHIVSHFLLKRIENIEGKTGRDYELGFTIEKFNSKAHFGRSVNPEKLDEIFGEITDKDIEENNHPLVVDNFFCSDCEKRFAVIETEYAKTIETKETGEYESGVSFSIGLLFWASLIWRMSVNGKSGVKLTNEQEEKLRQIIDCFLPQKIEELDEKGINENGLIKSLTYKLSRYVESKKDDAKWLFFHPEFYNPLFLLIDEFVLCFNFSESWEDLDKNDCLGLREIIKESTINTVNTKEKIMPFDSSTYNQVTTNLMEIMKNECFGDLGSLLDEFHVVVGGEGTIMPDELKKEIITELTSFEKKLGRKFTQADIVNTTIEKMKKYAP